MNERYTPYDTELAKKITLTGQQILRKHLRIEMNERIRELSYEAQQYALRTITGPDLAGINELWQEKFAELIVRECATVAFDDWCEGTNEESSEMAILKHFGIKQ